MGLKFSNSPQCQPHMENSLPTFILMSEGVKQKQHALWLPLVQLLPVGTCPWRPVSKPNATGKAWP